jgi:hypothetical protein
VPELQHYGLPAECYEIVRDLLREGYVVIPELPVLAEPKLTRYTEYSPEIVEKLERYSMLQIEGAFTKHPLQFLRRDAGTAAGSYYVDTSCGPRIRWSLPNVNTKNRPTLTPGSLSYEQHYLNPTTNQFEAPSEELKAAYQDIIKLFKRHLVRVVANSGERVWVGQAAKLAIDRGEVLLER